MLIHSLFLWVDVDECDRQMSHCDSNANCVNTIGSHECYCAEGYEGNGLNCTGKNKDSYWAIDIQPVPYNNVVDINECEVSTPCVQADCIDENGNYSCGQCYHGYGRIAGHRSHNPCCKLSK